MTRPKYKIPDVITWDSLNRLHKIVNHTTAVANEIDELGVNILCAGRISDILEDRQGISLWKLRVVLDELMKIEIEQCNIARDFDEYLAGNLPRPEEI